MRKMTNGEMVFNIVEFIMTQNYWEYYVTDDDEVHTEHETSCDIAFCLVHGFETELGYVDLNEIAPYITVRTKELTMQPAIGWKWVE